MIGEGGDGCKAIPFFVLQFPLERNMNERIWTGEDCNVRVYLDDGEGNRINESGMAFDPLVDLPLIDYCYWQSLSVDAELPMARRPCTGRPRLKIVRDGYIYQATVSYWMMRFSHEINLNQIFNREKCLQFEIEGLDVTFGKDLETKVLKVAYARNFKITSQSAGNAEGSAEFWAEQFE